MNGSMWCSHRDRTGMSRTSTSSSYCSRLGNVVISNAPGREQLGVGMHQPARGVGQVVLVDRHAEGREHVGGGGGRLLQPWSSRWSRIGVTVWLMGSPAGRANLKDSKLHVSKWRPHRSRRETRWAWTSSLPSGCWRTRCAARSTSTSSRSDEPVGREQTAEDDRPPAAHRAVPPRATRRGRPADHRVPPALRPDRAGCRATGQALLPRRSRGVGLGAAAQLRPGRLGAGRGRRVVARRERRSRRR